MSKISVDQSQSYVLENVEVTLTGRRAVKTLPSGKQDVQFEVTPKNSFNGNWKKWVRDQDLYLIEEE